MSVDGRFKERGFGLASFLESLLLAFGYVLLVVVIAVMLSGPSLLKNWLPLGQDQPTSNAGTSDKGSTPLTVN